mgnify:CR=1 FL=1
MLGTFLIVLTLLFASGSVGLVACSVTYMGGAISGAHFNGAISLTHFINGDLTLGLRTIFVLGAYTCMFHTDRPHMTIAVQKGPQ